MMMKTRFVLIETSHAGNVGAAARAMKTMGFDDLVLVRPRWANVLRREETIQRASGALDVLAKARIVDSLDEALDGISHLCATAMTPRDFGPPASTPREHFAALVQSWQKQELKAHADKGLEPDLIQMARWGYAFAHWRAKKTAVITSPVSTMPQRSQVAGIRRATRAPP